MYAYKISLAMNHRVEFGQSIGVCGSIKELGFWNIKAGFKLQSNQEVTINYLFYSIKNFLLIRVIYGKLT